MSARAHGTDEPQPEDPARGVPSDPDEQPQEPSGAPPEPARAADDEASAEPLTSASTPVQPSSAEAEPAHDGPTDGSGATDDADVARDLPTGEVDSQWSEIVTRLREPGDPRAWAPDPEVAEAEDHFVPPDPGPVLGGDPLLTMAWGAVVGAALMVVVVVVAWRDAPTWVLQAAGVALLGGAGLLVWRMPHERDEDDDDPGAVV